MAYPRGNAPLGSIGTIPAGGFGSGGESSRTAMSRHDRCPYLPPWLPLDCLPNVAFRYAE